jgi:hypothetical protein
MATNNYRTLNDDIFTQIETFLNSDAEYLTKKFQRLEDTDVDEIESNERLSANPYQFDLIITNMTEVDEDSYFADFPEENEICGGLNTSDPVNGTGYFDVTFLVRIVQPNAGIANDGSIRFSRPAIGNDILLDIYNNITTHKIKDHTSLPHTELNDKQFILSESNFTVVTKL